MATTNSPTIAAPTDLVEDKDAPIIPFPEFDVTILSKPNHDPDQGPNIISQPAFPSTSLPFNPWASGKGYPEFPPRCTNITRGFPVQNDNLPPAPMPVRCFPPPNNAAYEKALRDRILTRRDEEESYPAAVARLQVQRLKIVVPEDGYFREVEVDRSENWRPGLGLIGMKGEILPPIESGEGYGLGLRERVGGTSDGIARLVGSDESEEERGIWKTDYEMNREIGEDRKSPDAEELEADRETGENKLLDGGGEAEDEAESEDSDDDDDGIYTNAHSTGMSKGEEMAQRINFQRDTWDTAALGVGGDILSAEEQREDFIDDINSNGEQLDFCTVCEVHHIPPGPPITLADRDTCGSLLPKWFPSDQLERPWDTYRALINELVELEEKAQEQQARTQDPDKPRWDLEWHEGGPEWVAASRREGWWKCRTGPDAPEVERDCRVCHRAKGPGEQPLTLSEEDEMREERKRVLQGFIDQQVKLFGEMDKEIALAKIQLESMGLLNPVAAKGGEAVASGITEAMTREMSETAGRDLEEILGSKAPPPDEAEDSSSGSDSEDSEEGTPPDSSDKAFYF